MKELKLMLTKTQVELYVHLRHEGRSKVCLGRN